MDTNINIDVNNPLGIQSMQNIQGLQEQDIVHKVDEVISMLDSYLTEHKIKSAELENKSNILLTLVNDIKSNPK
jgi:hypothetical protein